ncbi:unnamed protein product [Phytomonas sp. Hart1]|nr:unnamed protein product [Phytomonas sp. Hart1]|eukprot:CCW67658.1 unnamed protein product [Phytomonas sp. isolate Hart1]
MAQQLHARSAIERETIVGLEGRLGEAEKALDAALHAVHALLRRYGGSSDGLHTLPEVMEGLGAFLSALSVSVDGPSSSLPCGIARLRERAEWEANQHRSLQDAVEGLERANAALEKALQARTQELDALAREMVHPDEVDRLEKSNKQLEERCELLRKEVKRQREQSHRDRAFQELSSGLVGIPKDSIETESALRAAASGVLERDMLSLATTQSQRDQELRIMRIKIAEIEKENTDLKKSCEHNNKVVIEYTKEIEEMKSNQRIQVSIEYVKNIIYQFLCANDNLRMKMIPAIGTVLEFNAKEKGDIIAANPKCPRFV